MEQRTRARELRLNATEPERRLWSALSARKVAGTRFNRQVVIGPFIADFAARSARLVVELDGETHAYRAQQDAERTTVLESFGYRVIRFGNADVMGNLEGVVARITEVLDTPSPRPLPQAGGELNA